MNQKISIIIPIYNTSKYLDRCINSVINQTYTHIEIILVDDGSTDGSSAICDEFALKDNRIKVIHKENGGLSDARNAGLDVASGEYVGFLDSDDYVSPEMYEKLIHRIEKTGCDIANAMYVRVDEKGEITPSRVTHTEDCEITAEEFLRELMLHTGDVSVCTKLFKREIFDFVRFQTGKLNEDLLFILDVLCHVSKIAFSGQVGYFYFSRSDSVSSGYGKAVVDMVENAVLAKRIVDERYPSLKKQTERFCLYQHMAYLLLVPKQDAKRENKVYASALAYIRKNAHKSFFNKDLTVKNKMTIMMQTIAPKSMAKFYQKREKRK